MDILDTHKPSDCVLLIGIPITLEAYDAYKIGEFKSDFLSAWGKTRAKFYNEICEPVSEALHDIRTYGCDVALEMNAQSILRAFQRDVVIIFSHWSDGGIEAFQRMMPTQEFCELIPREYQGVIDLCACSPEKLVIDIKSQAPQSTVKHSLVQTTPALWIEVVRIVLFALSKHELSYVEALELVLKHIERSNIVRKKRSGDKR